MSIPAKLPKNTIVVTPEQLVYKPPFTVVLDEELFPVPDCNLKSVEILGNENIALIVESDDPDAALFDALVDTCWKEVA